MDGNTLRKIRHRLKYTWQSFFGSYGSLTEVQLKTIPVILKGHNVVVSAPTATGKTEAVVAPVAELHREQEWPYLAVVYVAPTRALVNDLFERLEGQLSELYLTCVMKHGDKPVLPNKNINWLITTPESLDSLICRRPELFRHLRAVIVDEIHVIDGTYRGDQMRILLPRLAQLADTDKLSIHLLSATLPDPEAVARRYMRDFRIISVGNPRPIKSHLCQTDDEILTIAKERNWRKLLYFCNSRRCVEETSERLRKLWRPYPVVAHHGSLERHQRHEAEEVMRHSQAAVCVATSTLEIGVDIGNIDLVVLAEPPWSLEALLQRIGRGSRRSGIIQAAALYRTQDEFNMLQAMFDAARSGTFLTVSYEPDMSVIVQQALSLLYQNRAGIPIQSLVELLGILGKKNDVISILNYLALKGYCQTFDRSIHPLSDLLDLAETGEIHSNIPDSSEYQVVDSASGRMIGRIRGSFDKVFLLAGRSWKVIKVEGNRIDVRTHTGPASPATFGMYHNVGRFHYLLPPELRQTR